MASRIALVVGVGQYEEPYHPLKYCPPSAKDVFRLLTSDEFGQCESEPKSVLITDEQNAVTPSTIIREVDTILKSMNKGDMFIFYFCGHGDLAENKLFLMTNESKKAQDGYGFSMLMERLGNYNQANAILIVDACFSQAMFNSIKDWGQTRMPDNFGLMASAGHMQFAEDDPMMERTRFSFYFCEGIRNGCAEIATKDSPSITLDVINEYVSKQLTIRYGEYAQKVYSFSIGSKEKLWIAKRGIQEGIYTSPKPIVPSEMALEIFKKAHVSPKECDEVLHHLKIMRENLSIPQEKINDRYRIIEKVSDLTKKIEKHRISGRKDPAKANEREVILHNLQVLFSEYNKVRSSH